MLKRFNYRIIPSKEQCVLINKHIGASRFIYNLALETKQMAYAGSKVSLSCFDLHKQVCALKAECVWLKEINSQTLQQSITNLDRAFTSFFKGQNGFPKFKKKSNSGSFTIPQNVKINNDKLFIPKFKKGIEIILHRPIKGEIRQATVNRSCTGKYFVSILCETEQTNKDKNKIEEKNTIGIDLGIKTFIVSSDGKNFNNPKFLQKAESKLKYVQRKYSKYKGKKTKQRLALLHEKVVNKRKDFLHKVSTKLIRENQTIAIETLSVKNMVKNHNLAQAINDVSWSTFVSMLEYKAEWYGVNILKIGRFEPSSKMCSCCGVTNKHLTLKDRLWTCPNCNSVLDRDINASINIKNFALSKYVSGADTKNRKELPTLAGAMTYEINAVKSEGGSQKASIT